MNKYLSVFSVGAKQLFQFKGWIFGEIIAQIISAFLLVIIWSSIVQTDFTNYFIVVLLLLGSGRWSLYASINHEYNQEVRMGWSVALTKPMDWFSYTALRMFGSWFLIWLVGIAVGISLLLFLGVEFSALTLIISIPFILIFDIAIAYFISSFSYFVYSSWGLRVMVDLLESTFGGIVIPLMLIPLQYFQFLLFLPFPHKTYQIAIAILNGGIPIDSYIALILWSLILFVLGKVIHKKGREKFESLGG